MRYLRIVISFSVFLILLACNKEAELIPKDYPYVVTITPVVHENGTEFSAEIKSMGNQEILDYGFVWSQGGDPTIQDRKKIFEGKPMKANYSYVVSGDLFKGETYYVRAYIQTDQLEIYGSVRSFVSSGSLPPIINDFNPKYGPIGTQVIIEGENFSTADTGNVVRFGSIDPILDSVTEDRLFVTIPEISKPEKVPIYVETTGKLAHSEDSFDLWFPWKRLNDFDEGYDGQFPVSFSINDKGYFGLGYYRTKFWEYDPVNDKFTRKADLPNAIGAYPYCFTANEHGFVLFLTGDQSIIRELWEYNPATDVWTRKAAFPGIPREGGVVFSINDKGYIAGGLHIIDAIVVSSPKDFWEYDPSENQWIQKADFPGLPEHIDFETEFAGNFGFAIGEVGFVGISSYYNEESYFYKYDPSSDTWTSFGELPKKSFFNVKGFIITNNFYSGLGSGPDFWKFDPEDVTWKQMRSCPIKIRTRLNFAINDKGYLGIGVNEDSGNPMAMYEFDPSKN